MKVKYFKDLVAKATKMDFSHLVVANRLMLNSLEKFSEEQAKVPFYDRDVVEDEISKAIALAKTFISIQNGYKVKEQLVTQEEYQTLLELDDYFVEGDFYAY